MYMYSELPGATSTLKQYKNFWRPGRAKWQDKTDRPSVCMLHVDETSDAIISKFFHHN